MADYREMKTWNRLPGARRKHRHAFVLRDEHADEKDYLECMRILDATTAWDRDQFGEGTWDQYQYSFYFHSQIQATAFKLRWC